MRTAGATHTRYGRMCHMWTFATDARNMYRSQGVARLRVTHKYMVASMDMKEEALGRYASQNPFAGKEAPRGRYVPDDSMLAFLDSL